MKKKILEKRSNYTKMTRHIELKGEPKVKHLKWLTCNFAGCQLRGIGLAAGKERWFSGVLFRGLTLWISLISRGFKCLRLAEKLKLFLSSSVFMGSFSSYELFIIPRLDGVIHNSRFSNSKYSLFIFLNPVIHYSLFSFHPRKWILQYADRLSCSCFH